MKSPQAKRTLIGASAAVVIVAAIVIGIVVASGGGSDGKGGPGGGGGGPVASLPKGDLGLALTASKNDAMGVDPKAGFIADDGAEPQRSAGRSGTAGRRPTLA